MGTRWKARSAVFALALLGAAGLQATPAHAASYYTITNLDDSGPGSLRQAIVDANASFGTADVIDFSVTGTIALTSGSLPSVMGDVTIDGPGATLLTISGSDLSRVFMVTDGGTLRLWDVTVADGNAGDSYGGAIYSYGTLTIDNSTFSGNSAAAAGAIWVYGSRGGATVTDSTFTNNSVPYTGGAIANWGDTLTVDNSTFSGNTAGVAGAIGHGYGHTVITNSTFSGNSAVGGPGMAGAFGGAILDTSSDYYAGTLTIDNSTFSGNSASSSTQPHSGGAIFKAWTANTLTLRNTIVANSPSGGNCGGPFGGGSAPITDGGGNLQYPGTDCGPTITSADPLLDPAGLRDNDGPTQTIALQAGSPAIDAAVSCPPPATDQRGVARPKGGGCDIGALETGWFQVEAGVSGGGILGNWIHGQEWSGDLVPGDPARIVVTDVDGTTVRLDVTTTVQSRSDGGPGGEFEVIAPFELQPGMTITATASGTIKALVLVPLTIEAIDRGTGVVTGTASAGISADSILHVDTDLSPDGSGSDYISRWPGTDADGDWTADFGQALVPGNDTGADIHDEDGDATVYDIRVPEPTWTLQGFYAPVDAAPTWNTVKGGSTVPFKFEVFDGTTELTDVGAVESFAAEPTACEPGADMDPIDVLAAGGTSLRYDSEAGQFVYNWKTPKRTACYVVTMTTLDGSTLTANFKLR